ncbi:hypothetical protein RRF57_000855 [Xylaria bambusicola]|uniref:2EXR domain-containing protein n=1 Tax=Xylaria bambusicola TaxID=326684 RepID=A0AAN7UFA3_9PEZI
MCEGSQTFHFFGKLPAELRMMIWKYALYGQNRLVEIGHQKEGQAGIIVNRAPVPSLFLVNWEAYKWTKSSYSRLGPLINMESTPNSTGPLISFENDVFFVSYNMPALRRSTGPINMRRIASLLRHYESKSNFVAFRTLTRILLLFLIFDLAMNYVNRCIDILLPCGYRRYALSKESFSITQRCLSGSIGRLRVTKMQAYGIKALWEISADGSYITFTVTEGMRMIGKKAIPA